MDFLNGALERDKKDGVSISLNYFFKCSLTVSRPNPLKTAFLFTRTARYDFNLPLEEEGCRDKGNVHKIWLGSEMFSIT